MRCLMLLAALAPTVNLACAATPPQKTVLQIMPADFQTVVARYHQLQLQGKAPDVAAVKGWMENLSAEGNWPDIDYANQELGGWKTSAHLQRVQAMSRALVMPKSPLYGDAQLQSATFRALDHWLDKRYKNPNWWNNDIGVPSLMRDIIVTLGDRLQGDRWKGAMEVLDQRGHARAGDGANTIWEAELGLIYGALTQNAELVTQQSRLISDEIRVSPGEGIQSDWSFHQHGARLQQFHYGGAFLSDNARLAWILRATPWAIAPAKLDILANYALEGSQWMRRGINTVPGTLDRSVSRPGALHGGDLQSVLRFLSELMPARAPELGAALARQENKSAPLDGFRSFPRSDFAAYQRPQFAFFLKTISTRTTPTESINGENLRGHLLSCGDAYLVRNGDEYFDLMPLWNWDLLPGVTWATGAGEIDRQSFVGAISDGKIGASAMDYRFKNKTNGQLGARKLWANWGDTTLCLIGDLRTQNIAAPVQTALDQCRLQGEVTVGTAEGQTQILPAGEASARPMKWIHHANFVYIPIGDLPLMVCNSAASGSWKTINTSRSSQQINAPVFLPLLQHGENPSGQNSGYAPQLLPDARRRRQARGPSDLESVA